MKRIKWVLSIVFVMMCAFMFAEENDKHLYLKGEMEGIEIKIMLLSKGSLNYDGFKSNDDALNYMQYYYKDGTGNYDPTAMLDVCAINSFPVEIYNNSKNSIRFSKYNDSLTFIVNGQQMDYPINVDGDYPAKVFPSSKVVFTIKSLYTLNDYLRDSIEVFQLGTKNYLNNENLAKMYLLNLYPMVIDFGIKKGKTNTPDVIQKAVSEMRKAFFAVYELGMEKKEIYLYLTYE